MKTELADKLVQVIDTIQSGVAATSNFAIEQLPDVAQQYILYGRIRETMFFLLWAFLIYIFARQLRKPTKTERLNDPFPSVLWGFSLFFAVLFEIAILQSLIMVWAAPKIYLLQELAKLLK